jgi:hypothetical protein
MTTHDDQVIEEIPDHINDRNGILSITLLGVAIVLLLLLIIAIALSL